MDAAILIMYALGIAVIIVYLITDAYVRGKGIAAIRDTVKIAAKVEGKTKQGGRA